MTKKINAIRGMRDILPSSTPYWQQLETVTRAVFDQYGYQEIRLPILEETALFRRSIGEVTDIVEKEMYTFDDRNGESLTLRPEGTAGCVRAMIQNGMLHNQEQRLWYQGPMFRYERPQKGRYRQFHQIGVEVYGLSGADIEAELILMSARIWKALGLSDVRLELNTLGTLEERQSYRGKLVEYFEAHQDQLDEDSKRRLVGNPLRILDSKNPEMQSLIEAAPKLLDHLGDESMTHFNQLCARLDTAGQAYQINPRLVRGLDYYSHTVFEWVTESLGAQGTVCAGGRYDSLVEQLGGKPAGAVGFAMGMERLCSLMEESPLAADSAVPDLYLITVGEQAKLKGQQLAEQLRDCLPGIRLLMYCGDAGMKNQLKKANKLGAHHALILGEAELEKGEVAFKSLRVREEQQLIPLESIATFLQQRFT